MSKLIQKLKSKAGETLVESMAAILVFTFASIIMMSMVSAAADINTTAKEADRQFQEELVVVERGSVTAVIPEDPSDPTIPVDPHTSGTVKFTFGSVEETVKVDVFRAEGGDLYAYYAETPTTPVGEAGGTTE